MLQKRQGTDLKVKRATDGAKAQKLEAGEMKPTGKKQAKSNGEQDKAQAAAGTPANQITKFFTKMPAKNSQPAPIQPPLKLSTSTSRAATPSSKAPTSKATRATKAKAAATPKASAPAQKEQAQPAAKKVKGKRQRQVS